MDINKGIELFNDGSYFEAHDHFEEMWNEAERGEKEFYQGLVQISVGSYHLICGNNKGALSQYNKGMSKLEKLTMADVFDVLTQFRVEIVDCEKIGLSKVIELHLVIVIMITILSLQMVTKNKQLL